MSHKLKSRGNELDSTPVQLLTPARISLGLAGVAIPTREQLRFQLDHALARDAVHTELDAAMLQRGLTERNLTSLRLQSSAPDRQTYLRRPDLGRSLSKASREQLQNLAPVEVVFVIADGLSALAIERHALAVLGATLPLLPAAITLGPVIIATQARVALGDEIGEHLGANLTITLIGERPGLSSPDSLGIYLTWNPRPGRTDAERNCISNVRAEGLSYEEAARRITFYLQEAQKIGATGVVLKDPPASRKIGPDDKLNDSA